MIRCLIVSSTWLASECSTASYVAGGICSGFSGWYSFSTGQAMITPAIYCKIHKYATQNADNMLEFY